MKIIRNGTFGFLFILTTSLASQQRLHLDDFVYQGAFRLPDTPGPPWDIGWEWSRWASGLAFCPGGDPSGPDDGYPGSLFGVGHDHNRYLTEVSIPVPVISQAKSLDDLNSAETLQPFHDVMGGLFGEMELPRAGLAYLPAQGDQSQGRLYFCQAPHLDEGAANPSHGWCGTDLSDPDAAGLWKIGELTNYLTTDYLLSIPDNWADQYASGFRLGTGRYRDGGQDAMGPALFAVAPWAEGNPPPQGSVLPYVTLLRYQSVYDAEPVIMDGYHHSDEWSGCAWVSAGDRHAVIFAGTKGGGDCWYGCADGTDTPPWPDDCDRGWWSSEFTGQLLFYDAADLADVASGAAPAHTPQPYAVLEIDSLLYHVTSPQEWYHVGAMTFDRDHGLLYLLEPMADSEKPVVHVWQVRESSGAKSAASGLEGFELYQNAPNPFNSKTTISFYLSEPHRVRLAVYDSLGRLVDVLADGRFTRGEHTVYFNGEGLASGVYCCQVITPQGKSARKMVLME